MTTFHILVLIGFAVLTAGLVYLYVIVSRSTKETDVDLGYLGNTVRAHKKALSNLGQSTE